MNLPTFLKGSNEDLQSFFEEMFQTLRQGLSDNGWTVPQITDQRLTIDPVVLPDGTISTLAASMPDGTLWYVTDAVPPCYVGKISGALVKFTTTPYP